MNLVKKGEGGGSINTYADCRREDSVQVQESVNIQHDELNPLPPRIDQHLCRREKDRSTLPLKRGLPSKERPARPRDIPYAITFWGVAHDWTAWRRWSIPRRLVFTRLVSYQTCSSLIPDVFPVLALPYRS